jgi:hypothetical protein
MLDTMTRYLEGVQSKRNAHLLRRVIEPAIDRLSSQVLTNPGLVITGAGGTTAKIGAVDCYVAIAGSLLRIPAGTTMPPLTGCNFPGSSFNVAYFFVDGAGVITMLPGSPGTTLGRVVSPAPPKNKAMIGFLIINYTTAFTGGTTPLDTATTVYVNTVGDFDPTALTG